MKCAKWLLVVGLALNLFGVFLLFRYGLPYAVRTGGSVGLINETIDQAELQREYLYDNLGWTGLALIIAGTFAQIGGIVKT